MGIVWFNSARATVDKDDRRTPQPIAIGSAQIGQLPLKKGEPERTHRRTTSLVCILAGRRPAFLHQLGARYVSKAPALNLRSHFFPPRLVRVAQA